MPPIVIAGAIAGAGALGGAAVSAGAAGKASKAASKAAAQNAQIQQQQYEQTRSDLAPYNNAGYSATSALTTRLGLSQPASTPAAPSQPAPMAPAPAQPASVGKTGMAGVSPAVPDTGAGVGGSAAPAASGQPNWDQVLKDRPDVMAEYQRASSTADHNSPVFQQKGLDSPEHYAQYWYNQMGGSQQYQPPAAQAPGSAGPTTPAAPVPGQTFTSSDNGGLGPRPAMARPTFGEAQPTYGNGPSSADYLSNFQTSPGYQFRVDQGIRNLNAKYGARGLLKSDAAIKGINDYGQGQASQEYGNWFGQQMQRLGADQNQFNNNRTVGLAQYNQNRNVFNTNYAQDAGRSDANFNADRGYNTDQYNQYTGNLFQLAGMGQNAAAQTGAAGQNYANQATANNNSLASVKGNAAIAGANGINGAINSGMQAYGMYSNPFSGYASPSGNIPASMNGLY